MPMTPHRRCAMGLTAGVVCLLAATGYGADASESRDDASGEASKRSRAMAQAVRDASADDAAQEVAAPRPSANASPGAPDAIRVLVNGAEMAFATPATLQGGRPALPLREIAGALYVTVIDLGGHTFQFILPDGRKLTVTVDSIEPIPRATDVQLKEWFGLETSYDPVHRVLTLQSATAPAFQTYAINKSREELVQEAAQAELTRRALAPAVETGTVPDEAQPDVRLHGSVAYAYLRPHAAPLARNIATSVNGTAYDFEVRSTTIYKDINGVLRHDYNYLNLIKPDLFIGAFDQPISLYPLRSQSQNIYGARVDKTWQPGAMTTLAAGATENTVAGTVRSAKYLGHVYELQQTVAPAHWWRLKGGLLYFENHADLPELSGTSDFPRRNFVQVSGTELDLTKNLVLSADVAHSGAAPDNDPDRSLNGWNWRTGWRWDKERYRTGFTYEFVGDHYASTGDPASYRDYRGWDWRGQYDLTKRWTLSSSLLRYRNNVHGDPRRITTENQAFSLGSRVQITDTQSLNVRFHQFLSDPSGPEPGTSTRSNLYRADYFLPFLLHSRLLASYQYAHNDVNIGDDLTSHTVGASVFKSFAHGSSLSLTQQAIRTFNDTQPSNLNLNTSVNLDQRVTDRLSLFVNGAYLRDATHGLAAVNTVSGSTGVRCRVADFTEARVEYNVNNYNLRTERDRWPRSWSVLFYVSQAFDLVTAPTYGTVDGWVFDDRNANGVRDPGEPPVADAVLSLPHHAAVTTDAAGHFQFQRVTPGPQSVSLDAGSLDPAWALAVPQQVVEVRKRATTTVAFPIVKTASISGRVFVDENNDLVFQETEEPLEGVAVILMPGEQFRRTDANGLFSFDQLPPGRYALRVYREDLPQGYEIVSGESVDVAVERGQGMSDVNFTVRPARVPVTRF